MNYCEALQETLDVYHYLGREYPQQYKLLGPLMDKLSLIGFCVRKSCIVMRNGLAGEVSLRGHLEELTSQVREAVLSNRQPAKTICLYAGVPYAHFTSWEHKGGRVTLAPPSQLWQLARVVGLEMPEYDVIKRRMPE